MNSKVFTAYLRQTDEIPMTGVSALGYTVADAMKESGGHCEVCGIELTTGERLFIVRNGNMVKILQDAEDLEGVIPDD